LYFYILRNAKRLAKEKKKKKGKIRQEQWKKKENQKCHATIPCLNTRRCKRQRIILSG
jgi:hypothetical protein